MQGNNSKIEDECTTDSTPLFIDTIPSRQCASLMYNRWFTLYSMSFYKTVLKQFPTVTVKTIHPTFSDYKSFVQVVPELTDNHLRVILVSKECSISNSRCEGKLAVFLL